MLPEETQVEDSIISVLLLMLQLGSEFFLGIRCPFSWVEHLPPKMSVHLPASRYAYIGILYASFACRCFQNILSPYVIT